MASTNQKNSGVVASILPLSALISNPEKIVDTTFRSKPADYIEIPGFEKRRARKRGNGERKGTILEILQ
jgi:hypothetical protein